MTDRAAKDGRDIPTENPVAARRPLVRTVPNISAQEPQSAGFVKLVEGFFQVVDRTDHMDEDLVSMGASMIQGFAGVDQKITYLIDKVDVLAAMLGVGGAAPGLPPMRRREDSRSAIEDLSRHVSSNVREQAQKIVDDPESTLDPETVTKLAEDAVLKALEAQKERDRVKALEAEAAERARKDEEQKQRREAEKVRDRDFRRNLTIAIVGALITGAFGLYAAYMAGHEEGHNKGVVDTLQSVPALSTAPVVGAPVVGGSTTAVLPAPAAPAAVAPKK